MLKNRMQEAAFLYYRGLKSESDSITKPILELLSIDVTGNKIKRFSRR